MAFQGQSIKALAHDYETTGTDAWGCGVLQSALLIIDLHQDGSYKIHDQDVQLMNPGKEIHPEASKVHGYYAVDLIDFAPWEQYLGEQMATVNELGIQAVVGFNSGTFDNVIASRVGLKLPTSIDLIKAGRKFKSQFKWPSAKLTAVYKELTGKELVGAHDAAADVIGTLDMIAPAMKLAECATLDQFLVWMKGDDGTVEMKIGFGKDKGSKLKHLEKSYVRWLLSPKCNMNLSAELTEGLKKCLL